MLQDVAMSFIFSALLALAWLQNILSQLAAFDDDPEVEKTLEALTCSTARAGWTVAFHSPSHTDREAR